MTTEKTTRFDRVDHALRQLGAAERAPEAHGSLCGFTCVLGRMAHPAWVAGLLPTGASPEAGSDEQTAVLADLAEITCASLSAGDMAFTLLLPPDDRPLASRAEGLAEWCAGFMHGLGEAAGGASAAKGAIDGDVTREIMQDFGEIARVQLGDDDSDLEAEAAYTELVEFVRVSVQLIFEELYDVRRGCTSASVH